MFGNDLRYGSCWPAPLTGVRSAEFRRPATLAKPAHLAQVQSTYVKPDTGRLMLVLHVRVGASAGGGGYAESAS